MDEIDPRRTHFIHPMVTGENLEKANARDGDCRLPFTPSESFWIVAVCLAALGAALYAANAAQGVPV